MTTILWFCTHDELGRPSILIASGALFIVFALSAGLMTLVTSWLHAREARRLNKRAEEIGAKQQCDVCGEPADHASWHESRTCGSESCMDRREAEMATELAIDRAMEATR